LTNGTRNKIKLKRREELCCKGDCFAKKIRLSGDNAQQQLEGRVRCQNGKKRLEELVKDQGENAMR